MSLTVICMSINDKGHVHLSLCRPPSYHVMPKKKERCSNDPVGYFLQVLGVQLLGVDIYRCSIAFIAGEAINPGRENNIYILKKKGDFDRIQKNQTTPQKIESSGYKKGERTSGTKKREAQHIF